MRGFDPALFDRALFNPGIKLFNKSLFQTQPFDTGEPIPLPETGDGGAELSYHAARREESDVSLEYILQTNNLLMLCAAAFVQTTLADDRR